LAIGLKRSAAAPGVGWMLQKDRGKAPEVGSGRHGDTFIEPEKWGYQGCPRVFSPINDEVDRVWFLGAQDWLLAPGRPSATAGISKKNASEHRVVAQLRNRLRASRSCADASLAQHGWRRTRLKTAPVSFFNIHVVGNRAVGPSRKESGEPPQRDSPLMGQRHRAPTCSPSVGEPRSAPHPPHTREEGHV